MKKQVSLLTLTAALLLGACSTYEEVPATSGDGATAVGFLADIAPREQSRADINVDFGTGLTGTWNGEDNLGVLANDFTKLLQFTYAPDSKAFTGSLSGSTGTWAYRAFYPHNGNAAVSGTTVTVPFSALRTQNGNKYNSEFDIMAADAISAARPGARRENIENYVKRLEKLEEVTRSFPGIESCYAIQAGREIRVMVKPDEVSEDEMVLLARNIAKKIESELTYPGQIKVHVLRETKAVEYAK